MVIVGAGEAGMAAVSALRESGDTRRIVLISEEPHLPYERPPLSKEALTDETPVQKPIRPVSWFGEQAIELRLGSRVLSIDPARRSVALEAGGSREDLPYDQLLLATGARVRTLPGAPADICYLRTHDDSIALRARLAAAQRLVVIGGGVIGLEVASSARHLGKDVVVLDMAPRLMARALAPAVSEVLAQMHRDAGVDLRLGVRSLDLRRTDQGLCAALPDGTEFNCDLIVAGIGVIPNTELAAAAGCALENGILVDAAGQTSVPGIFAAGDAAAFPHPLFERHVRIEAWQHARRHGAHVGRAMAGNPAPYAEVPWFWSDQHGVNLQVAGLASECDLTVWRGTGPARTAFHFAGTRLVAATTLNNGRDMRPATNLIAAGWQGSPEALLDTTVPLGKLASRLLAGEPAGEVAA